MNLALLHIGLTDLKSYDIYYHDLLILFSYLLFNRSIEISVLQSFYMLFLLFWVLKSRLGFGDFLFILLVALFYEDVVFLIFIFNACLLALLSNSIAHSKQIPFGPDLVLSFLIIRLF